MLTPVLLIFNITFIYFLQTWFLAKELVYLFMCFLYFKCNLGQIREKSSDLNTVLS